MTKEQLISELIGKGYSNEYLKRIATNDVLEDALEILNAENNKFHVETLRCREENYRLEKRMAGLQRYMAFYVIAAVVIITLIIQLIW